MTIWKAIDQFPLVIHREEKKKTISQQAIQILTASVYHNNYMSLEKILMIQMMSPNFDY